MISIPRASIETNEVNKPTYEANLKFCISDLRRSGLELADMPVVVEPFRAIHSDFVRSVATPAHNEYTIPYYFPDGQPILTPINCSRMYRTRTTNPERRYSQPSRQDVGDLCTMPYFCPMRLEQGNKNGTYVIVEGEKKYAKLLKEERLYGCAIGGKDNWRGGDGHLHTMIIEDINAYAPEMLLIVPDGDWHRQDIFASYSLLIFTLQRRFSNIAVRLADLSGFRTAEDGRMGVDDYLVEGRKWVDVPIVDIEHELLLPPDVLIDRYGLDFDLRGRELRREIRQNHSNVEKLLSRHPMFGPESLWLNRDEDMPVFREEQQNIYVNLTVALQRFCHMPKLSLDVVRKTAPVVFCSRERSPLLEKISSFMWDGISRIERTVMELFKTDREHEIYRVEAVRRLFLQAIARKACPGCKADTVFVLVGKQGVHKSSLWEVLSYGSYFTLSGAENERDRKMKYHSKWFTVMEEMEFQRKTEEDTYKKDVTETEDTYRAPYAYLPETKLRDNVFVGNTNTVGILRGGENRREMPIWVDYVDLEWLRVNLDQLWAEALTRYKFGEQWWSEDESQWEEAKDAYREEVPHQRILEENIEMLLKGDKAIKIGEFHQTAAVRGKVCFELQDLERAINYELKNVTMRKLSEWMNRLGYEGRRVSVDGKQKSLWFKPKEK